MDKYINCVITADKNYLKIIVVLMTSILINIDKNEKVRFFIFSQNFSDSDELKILSNVQKQYSCEIVNVPMEQYLYLFKNVDIKSFQLDYTNIVVYFRLLMLKILPDDVEKCFYIDGDIIVDTDISKLFRQMPSSKLAAVVVEALAMQNYKKTLSHCLTYDDFKPFKKNRKKNPYFNAGFLLLNIKKAKELKLFEKAFDFLNRYPNPPYADQDTLNAIIGQKYSDKVIYLPPEWNVFCNIHYEDNYSNAWYSENKLKTAFEKPLIYHFAGANKPWINRKCLNYYDVWWRYCKFSIFKNMKQPSKEKKIKGRKLDTIRHYFLGVPYLKIRHYNSISQSNVKEYCLLNIIPLLKVKIKENSYRFYLFSVLPIYKIIQGAKK